jgi:3-dehydroquinate synthase
MKAVKTLFVGLAERGYDILIGDGLLDDLGGLLKPLCAGAPVAVVTDENVWRLLGERAESSLSAAGLPFQTVIIPAGEASKSMRGLSVLYDAFAGMKLARNGLVAALGGGVVGDLCGFAAATWMRGVRFVQVPTTLLAQVDSSVGGKTAINLPQGKNMAGVFYQPVLVAIDPSTQRTLPEREVRSGMAEVVKYGAIRSNTLFGLLSGQGAESALPEIIYECCRLKSEIVARDEHDFGERMLLNFGHTFGHAIEKVSGFDRYRHGEAVALGMTLAALAGEEMGLTAPGTAEALERALTRHGLDTKYRGDAAALLPALAADKKSLGGEIQMVLLRHIGEAFAHRVGFSEVGRVLKRVAEKWTR